MLRTNGDPKRRVFDPAIPFLHWLILFLVSTTVVLPFSIDLVSKENALALIQLHRSIGVTACIVTLGQLVWRRLSRLPKWSADIPHSARLAGHWSEYTLYALLLTQPILWVLQTNAHGDRVNLFFLGYLPALVGQDAPLTKQLLEVHETVGLLLLGLSAFHASAALYHHLWRRNDTFMAMLPPRLRRGTGQGTANPLADPWDPREE
jgi:cytochrome b561